MRLGLSPLLVLLLCTCARAQIIGFVDSVEVHRTDTIYFAFGSDQLSENAVSKVTDLATDRPGALELYLEGHTDAVGSTAANEALARRRSLNTQATATAAGWPADAIELRHFGERKLEVSSAGREARNRRVLLRSGRPKRYARLRGTLTNADGEPLAGVVIANSRYLQDTVYTQSDGSYDLFLPLEEAVQIDLYARRYFFRSRKLVLTDTTNLTEFTTSLLAATKGTRMSVPDLFFVGNKTELLLESIPTLPRLLQFMRLTPDVRIELAGHVNRPGPRQEPGSWSYNLAVNRAKAIYDYLIQQGISEDRLRFRGYSNFEMVFPKAKAEIHMRMNRRVELRVW